MHLEVCLVRQPKGFGERVEIGQLVELGGPRFEPAPVVGVAAAAHLDDERVESGVLRGAHHLGDAGRCGQGAARDPERSRLARGVFHAVLHGDARRLKREPGDGEADE